MQFATVFNADNRITELEPRQLAVTSATSVRIELCRGTAGGSRCSAMQMAKDAAILESDRCYARCKRSRATATLAIDAPFRWVR